MKRLLIDINSIVPYYSNGVFSGIGRTTMELLHAIAKESELPFEVILYSQNMRGISGRKMQLPFKNRHLYLRHTEQWNNIVARYALRELYTKYDLMHIPHNYELVRHPERCLVTLHDAIFMKQGDSEFGFQDLRRIIPPFARQCCHIVTCSESSKNDIVETMNVLPEKVTVVPWGIKHDTFYPQPDKATIKQNLQNKFDIQRPYYLSVSCDGERKRADILVRSYFKYRMQHGATHDLVLVWRNPPATILREVETSDMSQHIHFLQCLSDEDLAELYNGATALFFPSSYEGFGLPLLEAMACGIPVATCRNSSLSEIGGDVPYYLDEPIEDSIISMMSLFETSPSDMQLHIDRGINRASTFTWDRAAHQMINLYRDLLQV